MDLFRAHLVALIALPFAIGCSSHTTPAATAPTPPPATTTDVAAPTPATPPPAASDDPSFTAPRFTRTPVGDSGIEAYLPPGFPTFDVAKSPDNSDVFTGDLEVGGFHYACIGVRFKDAIGDNGDDNEKVLIEYLDYLKGQFKVTQAAGYGRGHTTSSNPTARGVIDFWADADGTHYAVEGWVTKTHLVVLTIYGAKDYPSPTAQQVYLEGARLP
jgi:hypothetical protein